MFDRRELLSDVDSMEDGANLIMIVSPVEDRIRANLFDNINLGNGCSGGKSWQRQIVLSHEITNERTLIASNCDLFSPRNKL